MKLKLFVTTLLFSLSALSAALCPPSSCNPHNGCMDGCYQNAAYGKADCNSENPQEAEKLAIDNGVSYAHNLCRYGFFYNSKWSVQIVNNNNKCQVQATASVTCMH